MFGIFKKKEKSQPEELVQGKYYVVKEQKPWGLYHIRTYGLDADISSYASADPANRLADIYNSISKQK